MFRKVIIVLLAVLFPSLLYCQSREKKALKHIRTGRHSSALALLNKALARDSMSAAAEYVFAIYFAQTDNEHHHIDSAYVHTQRAFNFWRQLPLKEKERLKRFPLDSVRLAAVKAEVEASAFEAAKEHNSETAYNHFIDFYPEASRRQEAIALRDQVAFDEAGQTSTSKAFSTFLAKYPHSQLADEATARYEYLIFQERTREKDLESYTGFLQEHPQSPYRRDVERTIFEIKTADGSVASFATFLQDHRSNMFARRASDILYHLLAEDHRSPTSNLIAADSLQLLENRFLVPFLSNDRYGFMDQTGRVVLKPSLDNLADEQLCGNLGDDLITLPGRIINQNGVTVLEGEAETLEDMGYGFVLVQRSNENIVLHKSGFVLPQSGIEDAKLIAGHFVALMRNGRWGLFTLHGREIVPCQSDEIEAVGRVVAFKIDGKYSLSTFSALAEIVNNKKGKFTDGFNELRKFSFDHIWVRSGDQEGLLDQQLAFKVKLDSQKITPAFFGGVTESPSGFSTFNRWGERSEYFRRIEIVNPWVAVKGDSAWSLFDPQLRIVKSVSYDTISIHGPFAIGRSNDGVEVHFHQNASSTLMLPVPERVQLVPSSDSVAYLALFYEKKWTVINGKGEKLFTTRYDHIQSAENGLFIVVERDKKGVVDLKGKVVLPLEYDAIGSASPGKWSLLKGGKFGLFEPASRKLLRPEYEKNAVSFSNDLLTVFKNGFWGFVDSGNKPVTAFAYQEVLPWADSVALVKQGGVWSLINVYTGKSSLEKIRAFDIIKDDAKEKLFIFHTDAGAGVLSSLNGVVIPVRFSDIVNVGSSDQPVYFTEKHVPEASLFVVIYYDAKGNLLRREVYEQDDYERIYCRPSART